MEKQFQFEVINFHSFAWIFNTTNIQNESTYTDFFRKQDAQLSDHLDDPEIFELVKTFQVHIYSKLAGNTSIMNLAFPSIYIFLKRQPLRNQLVLN